MLRVGGPGGSRSKDQSQMHSSTCGAKLNGLGVHEGWWCLKTPVQWVLGAAGLLAGGVETPVGPAAVGASRGVAGWMPLILMPGGC